MDQTLVMVTPADHGQPMGMEDFADAQAQPGYRYELGRGVVEVMEIPNLGHGLVENRLLLNLGAYAQSNPHRVRYLGHGSNSKILLPGFESERHPDISLYLSPAPNLEPVWQYWIPDIVVEVVSPGSEKRDYEEKRDEYMAAGVKEYWIVDPHAEKFLVLRRAGDRWKEISLPLSGVYEPPLLPGLKLDLSQLLFAHRQVEVS